MRNPRENDIDTGMAVAVGNILVLIALLCPVGADMWKDKGNILTIQFFPVELFPAAVS